jgi:membrane associated rhomboid family serine protease
MGIDNREYYREDGPSFGGTSHRRDDSIIKTLIIANVLVFLAQAFTTQDPNGGLQGGVTELLALSAESLRQFQFWRVVTYGFCHGSISHLVFNMLGLWLFGRMAESVLGSRETMAFYLATIVVSGLAHVGVDFAQDRATLLMGASGGLWGLTIVSAFYYPHAKMFLFMLPIEIELRWMAAGYLLLDFFGLISGGGNISHLAHIGGAVFGACYFNLGFRFTGGRNSTSSEIWSAPGRVMAAAKKKVATVVNPPQVRIYEPPVDEFEKELDRILEKINREGRSSLTAQENEFLQKASAKKSEELRNRQ